jgi:Flp pilus assembly protein TadG
MRATVTRRRVRHQRGQALPEFALIAPVLFLILFAVIQFGFLLGGQIGFTNGVREAARYASTVQTATAAQVKTELQTRALPKAIPGFDAANFDAGATTVSYCAYTNPDHVAGTHPSYSIKVRITAVYRHSLFMPLVDLVVDAIDGVSDHKLTATVTEEMRVENPRLTSDGGLPACP